MNHGDGQHSVWSVEEFVKEIDNVQYSGTESLTACTALS